MQYPACSMLYISRLTVLNAFQGNLDSKIDFVPDNTVFRIGVVVCPAQRIYDFTFFGFSKNFIVVNIYCVMTSLIYGLTFSEKMIV